MEGDGGDASVWRAVDQMADEIKRIDPHHPTMTAIAELGENAAKVRSIERFCPHIDIIGVNSYGGIESLGKRYRQAGGTKPYIVTEHGTLGPWEAGKTSWGSPIELTSTEKGNWYARGYQAAVAGEPGLCLGSYAFLWGHKQETTATWFGMLLPDGSRLEAVDAMTQAWTGAPPKNRCPRIESLQLDRADKLKPGDKITAVVSVSDPERDRLTFQWVLRSDAGTIGAGGDPQQKETTFAEAVMASGSQAIVTIPNGGGGYRLFAYVYDGHGGAAVANVAFYDSAPMSLESVIPAATLPCTANVQPRIFSCAKLSDQREREGATRAAVRIWLAALPPCGDAFSQDSTRDGQAGSRDSQERPEALDDGHREGMFSGQDHRLP
jgi:hypothetical protein